MDRPDDLRLPATTAWLNDAKAQNLCRVLMQEGHVYFVGGCVRDALLELDGSDVDLSTNVLPQEVMRLAKVVGFKAVPTGIDHGTVTVVVDGKGFEVTTFRRDVETDGRRAVVTFSKNMREDARRRDFTLNALYATPDGKVVDPLGTGIQDCLARRIRFIEDAGTRIREDYLRILRYFRFHARFADPKDGFDAEALDAIAQNAEGLERLSAERVGGEIKKLLAAVDPAPAVAVMRQTGCLARVLPGSDDQFLGPIVHSELQLSAQPDPLLRLAGLSGDPHVVERLRLSKQEARDLTALQEAGYGAAPLEEVAYRLGVRIAGGAAILRATLQNTPVNSEDMSRIKRASGAVFPVKARDLMPRYVGKALGAKITELEKRWIASDFTLTHEDLLRGV
ncbi:MAG: CCA tRNA nucleotidyltransferase [Roseobacter sp.]